MQTTQWFTSVRIAVKILPITNVVEWINNNYQTSNTSKCRFVSFGGDSRLKTCQGIKLVIDHENLESEDLIKYLVVVIHKNVTWNEHIWAYRIINCESEWKDWLVKSYETSIALVAPVALDNALIRPLLDFADTIWEDRDN